MKINIEILDIIKNSTDNYPYEIGGILGSSNGEIIDKIVIDKLDAIPQRRCTYEPNVEYLNKNIDLWQENDVSFKGIFHTHFGGAKTFSSGDVKYINSIMEAMPPHIEYLYFPIFVLPDCNLVCYRASMVSGSVHIQDDILIIE